MERQPSLFEEEWEGVSIHTEDFEPEVAIMTIPSKEKRNSFLETIGAEVKDVFGMGKEHVPTAAL